MNDVDVIFQAKIWHLPIDASADPVCNPLTTLYIGDRPVELVLWNPVAENVLALASGQSVKIYDVQQDAAKIGNWCIYLKQYYYNQSVEIELVQFLVVFQPGTRPVRFSLKTPFCSGTGLC